MAAKNGHPEILVRDMTFSYNGEIVLEEVNFSVDERDYVTVVGPNGGGKTTLLKLILGLLRPDKGEIRIFGMSPRQARPQIGYVPQQFRYDPKFPMRAIDVALMGRLKGLSGIGGYSGIDRKAAMNALDKMEMAPLSGCRFSQLSGGQRQRVLIARALASDPRLILLDEPTAHIDTRAQKELSEFLRKINKEVTVFMVTHDYTFVSSFVKSVLCVNRRVMTHPTGEIPEGMEIELFGGDVCYVRHDHDIRRHGDGVAHDE
jgi:zinc transport system ATP-binding protein